MLHSPISIDKITLFSVRPPELIHIFDQVGSYFRWFKRAKRTMQRDELDQKLQNDMNESCFIDGL